jgi:hypothetical protein
MKNIKLILIITFAVIGLGLLFWAAIVVQNYPGMKELRHDAFATVKTQYWIGLPLVIISYILTYVKKKF